MRLIKLTVLLTLSFLTVALANTELDALKGKAESGDVEAQYELGMRYFYGKDGEKDFFEAEKWFHEAADQGHVRSQYELGKLYNPEMGSAYGFEKRYRRYRYGNKKQHDLQSGVYGNPSDAAVAYDSIRFRVDAEKWFLMAAEQGLAEAQCDLGMYYSFGWGKKGGCHQEVIFWLEEAAQQNFVPAQYLLGQFYLVPTKGIGDLVRAHFWFNIIIENDSEYVDRAHYSRKNVTRRMTADQLQEAQLLFEKEKDKILSQNQE